MKKILPMLLLAGLIISGCGSSEKVIERDATDKSEISTQKEKNDATEAVNGSVNESVQKGYLFQYKGVAISVDANMSPILDELGEPASYFEAASCAFEGLDKIYTYNDFEIDTYPQGEEDFVSAIILKNDVVTTAEGIYIGCSKDEVTEAYGTDFTEEGSMLTYEKDGMKLCFLFENNSVSSIQYFSTVLDE